MKAKELIEELVKLVDEHGDLDVKYIDWDDTMNSRPIGRWKFTEADVIELEEETQEFFLIS